MENKKLRSDLRKAQQFVWAGQYRRAALPAELPSPPRQPQLTAQLSKIASLLDEKSSTSRNIAALGDAIGRAGCVEELRSGLAAVENAQKVFYAAAAVRKTDAYAAMRGAAVALDAAVNGLADAAGKIDMNNEFEALAKSLAAVLDKSREVLALLPEKVKISGVAQGR